MEKTAVVTGASRGIGAAAAIALAKEGYRVAVCCNTQLEKAQAVVETIRAAGGTAQAFAADVADEAAVKQMFARIERELGSADVLVSNAGIAQQKLFTDITAAEWDRMFDVCVKGAFHCCQAVLPHMIGEKHGRIILVSSMWGQVGASCEVHYSAAKAALIGLTRALAKEEGPSGITVNCVAPGVIETDMMASFSEEDKRELADETPLCRLGTPQDVAAAIAFLASDAGAFFTGQVLAPNGGFVIG